MALQVWLPLNGNLNNQGLTNWQFTNNNATVDNSGKIGKCYAFSGSSQYLRLNQKVIDTSQFTISFWMYATDVSANHCIFSTRNVTSGAVNIYLLSAGIRFDTSTTANWQTGFKPSANTWYHITLVQDATTKYLYVNGVLNTSTAGTTDLTQVSSVCTIGCEHINGSSIGTYFAGKLNDFRIYDRALAPKEIEILSRGLVAHYPLNGGGRTNNNMISGTHRSDFSTTVTSVSDGKLSVGSGGNGTFSITTDTTCPVGKYSYNVLNNTTGNRDFQQANIPYVTGKKYTGSWWAKGSGTCLYRVWNATKGTQEMGVTFTLTSEWKYYSHTFTATQNMGTDNCTFHLGVTGASSINICGMKLEEGEQATPWIPNPADTAYSEMGYNSTTEYDVSGYGYNGTKTQAMSYTSDTARYSVATIFDGSLDSIKIPSLFKMLGSNGAAPYSIAVWTYKDSIGSKGYQTILGGGSGFELEARNGSGTDPQYVLWNWGKVAASYEFGKWTHMVFTKQDNAVKLYVNGVLANEGTSSTSVPDNDYWIGSWNSSSAQNFEGRMSDFRIYATALSATQVAELYNTAVSVANNGTLMGYELVEG